MFKTASEGVKLAKEGSSLGIEIVKLVREIWPPAPETELPVPPVGPMEAPLIIFDQVAFDHDKNTLSDAARAALDKIVADLTDGKHRSDKILIEGHASAVGSLRRNVALSKDRARRVRDYLIDRGVQPERVFTYGFGEGYLWLPFFPGHPDNRRVRITTCGEGWGSNRCLAER